MLQKIISTPVDSGNEHFLPSSIQIPTFDIGNSAANVIPETARATINIRFNNKHTGESLMKWMQQHIDDIFGPLENASCTFTCDKTGESFLTKPGELTQLMTKSIAEVTGQNIKPELATDGGTSDARFIKDYCEIAELGIINQTLHQVDEFVYLSDIKELTKIYFRIIENYFKKDQ